jgi:GAF domain
MQTRGVRLSLAILFALATLTAAYLLVTTHLASRAGLAAHIVVDGELQALDQSIAELRTNQQAYVAAGQGEGYWISRVSDRLAVLRAQLAAATERLRSTEARTQLAHALAKLEDFEQMDRRVREYARGGQRLLASDLIFADGLEMTQAAQTHVARAQADERTAAWTALRASDWRQAAVVATTGAAALIVILLLVHPTGRAADAAAAESEAGVRPSPDVLGLTLHDPLVRRGFSEGGPTQPAQEPSPAPGPSPIPMTEAADLCADLCRVHEPGQLPELVGRAARVLDAGGIIVWMADPDRRELVPTLTHGYSPAALARFGTIPRDADNATAAAFREAVVKTVAADGPAAGAIVAPLVTPSGCVGVMAAEVGDGREHDAGTHALARIISAQLAALLGPPPAAARAARAAEA